jgi:hypothetical protein
MSIDLLPIKLEIFSLRYFRKIGLSLELTPVHVIIFFM